MFRNCYKTPPTIVAKPILSTPECVYLTFSAYVGYVVIASSCEIMDTFTLLGIRILKDKRAFMDFAIQSMVDDIHRYFDDYPKIIYYGVPEDLSFSYENCLNSTKTFIHRKSEDAAILTKLRPWMYKLRLSLDPHLPSNVTPTLKGKYATETVLSIQEMLFVRGRFMYKPNHRANSNDEHHLPC
jgi:hypothetical protein